jgi:MoaA/NifB/PqqE/SkfB family radical SAM enzyme
MSSSCPSNMAEGVNREQTIMNMNAPILEIWTIIDMVMCNFNCPYCASTQPDQGGFRSKDKLWEDEKGSDKFQKIIRWISQLPMSVGVRLQTVGEPFMCEEFLRGAAWLSNQPNIHYLELVTNGSLVKKRWEMLAHDANLDKLSLWMTYHNTQISAKKLVDAARFARDQGVHVVVNSLAFPNNYEEVEHIRALCEASNLRISTDVGYDLDCRTSAKGFIPAFYDNESRTRNLYGHNLILNENISNHWQERCSTGHDYIYISSEGDIYRCFQYFLKDRNSNLGNVFDTKLNLSLRTTPYAPCLFSRTERCFNHEDFFHLETIGRKRNINRSMTYKDDVLK